MNKWFKNVVFAAATLSIAATPLILSSCTFTTDDPQPEPQPEPTPPEPEPEEPYLSSISITIPQDSYWLQEGKTERFEDPILVECLDQNKNPIESDVDFVFLNLDGTQAPDWIWVDSENKINISAIEQPSFFEFFVYAQSINKNIQSEMHKISVEIIELQPIAPERIEVTASSKNPNLFYTDTLDLELGLKVEATDVPEELISKDCQWELTSIKGKKIVDLNNQPLFRLEQRDDKHFIVASTNVDSSYIGSFTVTVKATSSLDLNVSDDVSINVSVIDGFYYFNTTTEQTYTRSSLDQDWSLSLMSSSKYTLDNVMTSIYGVPVSSVAPSFCSNSGVTKLSSAILPESITTIGEKAFSDQTYLYSVAIPGVKYVEKQAFNNCINMSFLRNYDHPVLKSAADKAFYGCSSLTFNDSITHDFESIGDYAFNRVNVTTFNVGKSIVSFGIEPFSNCPSLQFINILNSKPPKLSGSLCSGSTPLKYIRVPANSVETYKKTSGWSVYSDKILGF